MEHTDLLYEREEDRKLEILALLGQGADINTLRGESGLVDIFTDCTLEFMEFLLSHGTDINLRDTGIGKTPLMLAVVDGNVEKAKYLLEKGCDPDMTDVVGTTVLDYALCHNNPLRTSFGLLLLRHGAKLTINSFDCIYERLNNLGYYPRSVLVVLCAPNHFTKAVKRPWLKRDILRKLKDYLI